jgi:Flp pilus assembly protein TadG
MRRTHHRYGRDEGATAVEGAITLSILLVLLIGIFNFGTALWQLNTMQLAVEQAGRYMMINNNCGNNCAGTAETQMQLVLPSASTSCPLPSAPAAGTLWICATENQANTPNTVTLSAVYGYDVIFTSKILLGGSGTFAVGTQATFPLD